jgi:hypothetical protein
MPLPERHEKLLLKRRLSSSRIVCTLRNSSIPEHLRSGSLRRDEIVDPTERVEARHYSDPCIFQRMYL